MSTYTPQVQPQIVVGYGVVEGSPYHTEELARFEHRALHRNLSCVMVTPSRGSIPARVVDSWLSMLKAPNQPFSQLFGVGMEVGHSYDSLVGLVLHNEQLRTWKYILTVEEDNLPPPMGFVKLLEAADEGDFDVLGGLYYVKGLAGFAQIWGDPDDEVENYRPLPPADPHKGGDEIVRCRGTGMGFTLFRRDVFERVARPWFVHDQERDGQWTQDLYFFHHAHQLGVPLKVGVHCGVRVGHMDIPSGAIW